MTIADKLTQIAENERLVFEAGKNATYSEFWGAYQQQGDRQDYRCAFCGSHWDDSLFYPYYDIRPVGSAASMFEGCAISNIMYSLYDMGVTLDTSQCTNLSRAFADCKSLCDIPAIDACNATDPQALSHLFSGSDCLYRISITLRDDGSQDVSTMLTDCTALEDLSIYGCIGSDFNAHWCTELYPASLVNILNVLADYSGDTATHTCSLGAANLAKLTDAEKAIATQKGWTLA